MPSSSEWLNDFLYFLGRRYAYVLLDISETYLFHQIDRDIVIERYCEQKSLEDIAQIHNTTEIDITERIEHILEVLLGVRLQ